MSPLDKPRKVPRLLARVWRGLARGVCLALGFGAGVAQADIVDARYDAPTSRYAHAVLGDEIEYGVLRLKTADGRHITITLAKDRVFEDVAPRVVDVTGDGAAEVVVVESHQSSGARLAIYNSEGLLAATPYIAPAFAGWRLPGSVRPILIGMAISSSPMSTGPTWPKLCVFGAIKTVAFMKLPILPE